VRKIFILAFCIFSGTVSFGQNELTFPHLENVLQSSYINPAHVPEHKVSIGLPGISSLYGSVTNTGFSFHDLVQHRPGDIGYLNFENMHQKLRKENYLHAAVFTDLFSIRVKVRHFYWSFNITEKFTTRFSYPKDLITLAIKGNEPFFGGEVNLKNIGLDITHHREFGLGMVKQYSKFIVGVRVKYIQGLANVNLRTKNLKLETEKDLYIMKLTANATVNTAGIPAEGDDKSFGNYMTNTSNPGAGIDAGFSYKFSRKFIISAAVNNIGFIHWKSDVNNYNIEGGSEFKGVDLAKQLVNRIGDTTDFAEKEGEKYLDSLKNAFNYSETKKSYSTWLIPQLYITGKYSLGRHTQAIGSVYLEKYKVVRPAFTLGIYQELGRTFNAILTYSVQYGRFDNVGLGIVIKPPFLPLQLYLAGDNLFNNYYTPYYAPMNVQNFNLRFGINLVFGYVKTQDKLSYPRTAKR
jgi:hypothetical protein